MTYLPKLLAFIKTHKLFTALIIIIIAFGGYRWYAMAHAATGKVQYVTGAAEKTTIVSSITSTGQVSAQNKIDLKPGGSGQSANQLISVNVKQSDQVKAGQIIATVDEKSNSVALAQAEASVASAKANYDKLVAGLTGNDLAQAQLSLQSSQKALDKSKTDYDQTVKDQQKAVDKAFSDYLNNNLVLEPNNTLSSVTLTLSGSYTGTTQGSYSVSVNTVPDGFFYNVTGLSSQSGRLNRGLMLPLGNGLYVTFSTTGTLDSSTVWTINIPNMKSNTSVSSQTAYQNSLDNQTQSLKTAQTNIENAQDNLTQAQLTYNQKTQAPANADVAQARAQVLSAQANLAQAEANYNNNILKAPFDGQVAQVNNQPGDQVTSSTVIATIITNQKLAIVTLNEVDAAKVTVGQKVNLSFDALDGLNIVGTVAQLDTIGTVSQGVVTYTAKIGFDSQDDRIKPGMNAAASIITAVHTDVLAVPSSSVKTNGTGTYVQILDASGKPQNKTVQVGISDDTYTEITSGLNESDMVVTQTITNTKTTTPTTTRTGGSLIPGLGGGTGGAAAGGGATRFRTGN